MANEMPDLINLLFTTVKSVKENFKQNRLAGVTFGQLKTLLYIDGKNQPTMKAIADEFGITPPSATDLITPFVLHGLVKKVYDKKDRRVVRLALTAKGKTYLEEHVKNMTEKMEKLIANLNNKQIKNFREILEILLKNSKK